MSHSFYNFRRPPATHGDPYQAYQERRYQDAYSLLDPILRMPLLANQQQMDPDSLRLTCLTWIDLHILRLKCMMDLYHKPLEEFKTRIAETEHIVKTLPLSDSDRENYLTKVAVFNKILTETQQAVYRHNYALTIGRNLIAMLGNFSPKNICQESAKRIKNSLKDIENEAKIAASIFKNAGKQKNALDAIHGIILINDKIASWLESSATDHHNLAVLQLSDECYETFIKYYQAYYQPVFLSLHLGRFYVQERIIKLQYNEENAQIKLREFIENYFDQEPLEQYLTKPLDDENDEEVKADMLRFIYDRFKGKYLEQLIEYHIKAKASFRQQFEEYIGVSLPAASSSSTPSLPLSSPNSRIKIWHNEDGVHYSRPINYPLDKKKKRKTKRREFFPIEESELLPLIPLAERKKEGTLELEPIKENILDLERAKVTSEANKISRSEIDEEDLDPAYLNKKSSPQLSNASTRLIKRSFTQSPSRGKTITTFEASSSSSSPTKRRHSCRNTYTFSKAAENQREAILTQAITTGETELASHLIGGDETYASKPITRGDTDTFLMYALRTCPKEKVAGIITALLPGSLMNHQSMYNLFSTSTKNNASGDLIIKIAHQRGIVENLLKGLNDAAENAQNMKQVKKIKKDSDLFDSSNRIRSMINELLISNQLPPLASYFSPDEIQEINEESGTESVASSSNSFTPALSSPLDKQAMNEETKKECSSLMNIEQQNLLACSSSFFTTPITRVATDNQEASISTMRGEYN